MSSREIAAMALLWLVCMVCWLPVMRATCGGMIALHAVAFPVPP